MPFQPVLEPQPLLLVPPLLPPLVLRTENGFFGAPRGDLAAFGDCPPCARFEEPPFPPPEDEEEPDDEGRPVRFVQARVHEALDLEGEAGDCVFAAYTGRVVEVESAAAGPAATSASTITRSGTARCRATSTCGATASASSRATRWPRAS